jgi:D-ribose pyranose/furanose isomerase RbsD
LANSFDEKKNLKTVSMSIYTGNGLGMTRESVHVKSVVYNKSLVNGQQLRQLPALKRVENISYFSHKSFKGQTKECKTLSVRNFV